MRFHIDTWQAILLPVIFAVCMVLAGCADAPPTPTAVLPTATQAPSATVAAPTATFSPTPSPLPTLTPTPSPTTTPTPSPTATPTLTPTPTPTLTPTPTVSPTLTWTPSPGATLQTSAQWQDAMRHQTNGNYAQAIVVYLSLLEGAPTPDEAREIRYHLAESYLANREYLAAAVAWEQFLTAYPDDARVPRANFMLARALHAANECARAIPYYQAYLSQEAVLADMVYDWVGDCHAADENLEEAIVAYRKAVDSTTDRSVQVGIREKIADAYLLQEDYDAALAEYDAILNVAEIDSYRAKIEFLAGRALAAAGRVEAAHERYRRAVDKYPKVEFAYFSLIELVDAAVEVDDFQRGLIDYYAGADYPDAYGAAVRAFDRYLASEPAERADEALYLKAVALRAMEQPLAALMTLETLIADYPESSRLAAAWLQKGITLAGQGDNDGAVKVYQDLASFFPGDTLAPQALWRAAKLREGERAFAGAAELYKKLQADFPGYENADEALWRAGLSHYQVGDLQEAADTWETLLEKYPKSAYRARTVYWLGKLDTVAGSQKASDYWDQLVSADPRAYYALRVKQIRSGESLTATRLITAAIEPPTWDADQAATEILAWLRGWTDVPTGTTLVTLPVKIIRRSDFQRGQALLSVGLRTEALSAFNSVRAAAWNEPVTLAQLAIFFREIGLHGLAARAAARQAVLWPGGSIHTAPLPIRHLAYPLAYTDLLSSEAQTRNLDPLLMAALIRQESLFEPAAQSYAGARGLGQVMPATGKGIATTLGMEDFVLDDLYRPWVSVRFGAFYLDVQMGRFDDQILISLAAYNGGPGNTLRWLEAGGDDLDLFVEVITATQSRHYLQKVYEQYIIYETLYRPTIDE